MNSTTKNILLSLGAVAAVNLLILALAIWAILLGVFERLGKDFVFVPEESEELTIVVDSSETEPPPPTLAVAKPAPPVPAVSRIQFVPTDGQESSAEAPPSTTNFISDRNTTAASEKPSTGKGTEGLPTQDGVDIPVLGLTNQKFVEGELKDAQRTATGLGAGQPAPPTVPPQPEPLRAVEIKPAEPVEREDSERIRDFESDLAAVDIKDLPKPKPETPGRDDLKIKEPEPKLAQQEKPKVPDQKKPGTPGASTQADDTALQRQILRNKIDGAITKKGKNAVDAKGSPLGIYMSQVSKAVQAEFHPACARHRDRLSFGTVRVSFDLNRQGKAENVRVLNRDESSAVMQEVVIAVILASKIPPIPADLEDHLIDNRLHITYGFVFH